MSAESVLVGAVEAALAGVAGLNRVEPGASVRATPPYAEIGPVEARDWGTKDAAGREVRLTVTVRDAAERAERLHVLSGAVQDAVAAMPRDLSGWRVASLVFVRSRVASEKAGNWAATVEYRVRVLATA
jgi:hypothetical protein